MRNLREIYRLRFEARLSQRKIARCINASTTTVGEYLKRFEEAGLTWPLPEDLSDAELEKKLFPSTRSAAMKRPVPNWAEVQKELKSHKGVTLQLLWKEYKARHPDEGYCCSHFCALYREWRGQVDVTMRQDHKAGEKLFVDYAGVTVPVTNPTTGEIRQAQIFVATLGASYGKLRIMRKTPSSAWGATLRPSARMAAPQPRGAGTTIIKTMETGS